MYSIECIVFLSLLNKRLLLFGQSGSEREDISQVSNDLSATALVFSRNLLPGSELAWRLRQELELSGTDQRS